MQSWIADICDVAHCLQDADAKASEEDVILVPTQGSPSTLLSHSMPQPQATSPSITSSHTFSTKKLTKASQAPQM